MGSSMSSNIFGCFDTLILQILFILSNDQSLKILALNSLRFQRFSANFWKRSSQWQTTYGASLVTVTSTCEEYKDTLISAINAITKHSFLAKCQANFLIAKKKLLKVNEMIVLGDFAENDQFHVFLIVVDYLKENLPIVYKIFYFSDGCAEQCKCKNFINLCHNQQRFQCGCWMDSLCNKSWQVTMWWCWRIC